MRTTLPRVWRTIGLPIVILLLARTPLKEHGPAPALLAAGAYAALLLFRRPPPAALLFVGAWTGWLAVGFGLAGFERGWPLALRHEFADLALILLVAPMRGLFRLERPNPAASALLLKGIGLFWSLALLALALLLARRDLWPAPIAAALLVFALSVVPGVHGERLRGMAVGGLGVLFAIVALGRALPWRAPEWQNLSFLPLLPMILALGDLRNLLGPERPLPDSLRPRVL